jgi:hypothetical protein
MTRLMNTNTFEVVDLRETVQDPAKEVDSFDFTLQVQTAPPPPPPEQASAA